MIEKNGELWDIRKPENKKEYDETIALFKDEVKIGKGRVKKTLTISLPDYRMVVDNPHDPNGARSHMGAQKPASDTFPFFGRDEDGNSWRYSDDKVLDPTPGGKGNDGKGNIYIIDRNPGGYITIKGMNNVMTEDNIEKVYVLLKLGKLATSKEECYQGTHNYYIKNESVVKTMSLDKETMLAELTLAVNKMDAIRLRSIAQAMLCPYVSNYDNDSDLRFYFKGWLSTTDKRDGQGKQVTSEMKIKDFFVRYKETPQAVNSNRKDDDALNIAVSVLTSKENKMLSPYYKEYKWLFKPTKDAQGEVVMIYNQGENPLDALMAFLHINPDWASKVLEYAEKLQEVA